MAESSTQRKPKKNKCLPVYDEENEDPSLLRTISASKNNQGESVRISAQFEKVCDVRARKTNLNGFFYNQR